ncbi:MAG: DUF1893 domain-containing protein [Bacteroidales bacterium]|nr:DUF1893 domain-containing protein [Bacteroidales bacterium]
MKKIGLVLTVVVLGCLLSCCSISKQQGSDNIKMQKFTQRDDYSCIITNNGITKTYHTTGIYDLYHILCTDKQFLNGAEVTDRAIGKAAAALMIIGGIKEAKTPLISTPAKNLFLKHGVKVSFDKEVDNILNRNKTGLCPMEKRIVDTDNLYEIYVKIEEFVNE